jgi:signal transduction histidine kinase
MEMNRTNILLVDDKPERLLTYEACLERLDQNLVRAQSGEEALAKLEGDDFAAVLLDISMPDMDGFETAARIRELSHGAQTPIIFVTGVHLTDFDRLKGYEMGAADYIYIPVVPEILRGKVGVLVQLYQQQRELSELNAKLLAANGALEQAHEKLKAQNTRELRELNASLEAANKQLRLEVTERRAAEQRLTETAQRKDEFISILAHELRNPLAAIRGGVDLMRQARLPKEQFTWAREMLERQVHHLMRLIEDLLDVSRVTTGRVQLQTEVLDLNSAVREATNATRQLVDAKRHQLSVEFAPKPLYVRADPVRLTQVFGNLLDNAAKYMHEGGRIFVRVEPDSAAAGRAVVRVRDEGMGLPPHMLEQVFELFTQVKTSTHRTQSGLGIGLALVRNLVELHGGSVRAISDGLGTGSEFIVELPLPEEVAIAMPAQGPAEPAPTEAAPLRLLIVDDNVDAVAGLARYFQANTPYEIRVAHTGAGGVAAATEFWPEAVLLDIGLPDIDGFEVARRLRMQPGLDSIPLIAITGFGSELDRQRASEAGFDHFLVKPVSFALLHQLLNGCCHARQSGAAVLR